MKYAIETLEIERARLNKVIRELEEIHIDNTSTAIGEHIRQVDNLKTNLETIEQAIKLLREHT